MDLHYKQEATVGALVILAVTGFILGTMWLAGKSLQRHQLWQVRFANVGKLQEGSYVKISGVRVGRVARVEFQDVGNVVVKFSLPPKIVPHTDANASIVESLAFSEATLVFDPGSPSAPLLDPDSTIQGVVQAGVFDKAEGLADRADSVMIGVQAIANERTAADLRGTLQALQRTLNTMNTHLPTTTDEATKTMMSLRRLTDRLDSTLAEAPIAAAVRRADTLASSLTTMSAQLTTTGARLDSLLAAISRGEGSLGKFATDSGLYTDARGASQSLKALMDELQKHPGKITVQVKLF